MERNTQFRRDIPQLRRINQNPIFQLLYICEGFAVFHRQVLFARDHPLEYGITDMGFEKNPAHPSGRNLVIPAVIRGDRVGEFSEYPSPKPIVPVNRTHPGAGQHAAEPGRLFDKQCFGAASGSLKAGGHTAGSAPDHHDIIVVPAAARKSDPYKQAVDYLFHIDYFSPFTDKIPFLTASHLGGSLFRWMMSNRK